MPELNKWQKREAEQHAKDNDVSYEAAVKDLFPEPEQAPKPAPKVDTVKAKA